MPRRYLGGVFGNTISSTTNAVNLSGVFSTSQQNYMRSEGGWTIPAGYYQNNPAILSNLRGQLYEEKILKEIKLKAKPNLKEINKDQAEKILKEANEKHMKEHHDHNHDHSVNQESPSSKKELSTKKTKTNEKKPLKAKKVSKK